IGLSELLRGWSAGNRHGLSSRVVPQVVGLFSFPESRHGAAHTRYFLCRPMTMPPSSAWRTVPVPAPQDGYQGDDQTGNYHTGVNYQHNDQSIHDTALVVRVIQRGFGEVACTHGLGPLPQAPATAPF